MLGGHGAGFVMLHAFGLNRHASPATTHIDDLVNDPRARADRGRHHGHGASVADSAPQDRDDERGRKDCAHVYSSLAAVPRARPTMHMRPMPNRGAARS